jgi:hypothetical protein
MFVMVRDDAAPALTRWSVDKVESASRRHLLLLPSEDYVNPHYIDMIRCAHAKADRTTGEVGAVVHIECKGSWFTCRFDEVDEARGFARAICNFRDETH